MKRESSNRKESDNGPDWTAFQSKFSNIAERRIDKSRDMIDLDDTEEKTSGNKLENLLKEFDDKH